MDDSYGDDGASFVEPLFGLSATGPAVFEKELLRTNNRGDILLRVPLSAIQFIKFCRPISPMAYVFLAAAIGLSAVAWWVSEHNWLTRLIAVLAIFVAALGVIGIRDKVIILGTKSGNIKCDCSESPAEAESFAVNFQEYLMKRG